MIKAEEVQEYLRFQIYIDKMGAMYLSQTLEGEIPIRRHGEKVKKRFKLSV